MAFVNYSLITAFRCKEASIYDLCANPLLPIALIVGNKKIRYFVVKSFITN